jgi:hypothetical protein
VIENADQFDDVKRSFLGVSIDPSDKVATSNGVHYFLDRDGILSRHCGASPIEDVSLGTQYRVTWTILDPSLHVLAHFHTGPDRANCEKVFALIRGLPASDGFEACEIPAPILVLPRVFDPAFCDRLTALLTRNKLATAASCAITSKYSITPSNAGATISSKTTR